jgi:flagellar biogenesis protein FliO
MDILEQLAAVGAVLALLAATLWWLKRRGIAVRLPVKKAVGRKLECLERLPLGPQHTLHLVRLGETALLVSSSPSGCALVESLTCREIGIDAPEEAWR